MKASEAKKLSLYFQFPQRKRYLDNILMYIKEAAEQGHELITIISCSSFDAFIRHELENLGYKLFDMPEGKIEINWS